MTLTALWWTVLTLIILILVLFIQNYNLDERIGKLENQIWYNTKDIKTQATRTSQEITRVDAIVHIIKRIGQDVESFKATANDKRLKLFNKLYK